MPPKGMRRSQAEFENSANPDSPLEAAAQQPPKRRSTRSNTQQAPMRTEKPVTRSTAQLAAAKPRGERRPSRTEAQLLATSTQEVGYGASLSGAERSVLEREVMQRPQETAPAASRPVTDNVLQREHQPARQADHLALLESRSLNLSPLNVSAARSREYLAHLDDIQAQREELKRQEEFHWRQQERARIENERYQERRRREEREFLHQLKEQEREAERLRQQAEMQELRKQQYLEELKSQRLDDELRRKEMEQHAVGELQMNHWTTPHGSSDESETEAQYALIERQPEQVLTKSPIPPPVDSLHALRTHSPLTTPGGSKYRTSPTPRQRKQRESYKGDENAFATEPTGPTASPYSLATSTPKRDSKKQSLNNFKGTKPRQTHPVEFSDREAEGEDVPLRDNPLPRVHRTRIQSLQGIKFCR